MLRKRIFSLMMCLLVFLSSSFIFANETKVKAELVYTKGVNQEILYGKVEGIIVEGEKALAWLGVPYAKPPVNDLRWKAPQKPEKWNDILETKEFPNMALQLSGAHIIGSEDCLYLNIYRPNSEDVNLPVMVFIHGGNNQSGSSQSFKGDVLATNTNSIIVSIQYRLGALGWLNIPAVKTGDPLEDSGNFGLLDIHESLVWVNENIKAFGGNPNNVTISGQSAGGRDVMATLISPLFKGDFHKAIALSGGMTVTDPQVGQEIATRALGKLVVEDSIKATNEEAIEWLNGSFKEASDYLKKLSGERMAGLMTNAAIRMEVFPHLFADGVVIPKEGFGVFETGEYNKVPIILGSDYSEFSVFAATDPLFVKAFYDGTLETDEILSDQFEFVNKYGSMLYSGFNADKSAEKLAEIEEQPGVYAYRFIWGEDDTILSPGWGTLLGAFHGIDMDFVTGKNETFVQTNYTEANRSGREALTRIMHQYIKNFLHTGNPNGAGLVDWSPWSNSNGEPKLIVFDADKEKAIVKMTSKFVNENEVFKAMDADNLLSNQEKKKLIATVLSGRFFSTSLDKKYNE